MSDKLACVIGDPIEHSKSPLIHNYLLKSNKIDGHYERIAVTYSQLKNFCQFAKEKYCGFNVTIPHKETIMQYCDSLTDAAKKIGAVNTVKINNNQLIGDNTDGCGFIKNISFNHPEFNLKNKNVIILGAGGATRAIIYALLSQNVQKITIVNRTIKKGQIIADDFNDQKIKIENWQQKEQFFNDCDLLVNTTSLGMTKQPDLKINLENLPKNSLIYDIVYNPLITNLLKQAQGKNLKIITGIGMLIFQAIPAFEQFFQVKNCQYDFNHLQKILT